MNLSDLYKLFLNHFHLIVIFAKLAYVFTTCFWGHQLINHLINSLIIIPIDLLALLDTRHIFRFLAKYVCCKYHLYRIDVEDLVLNLILYYYIVIFNIGFLGPSKALVKWINFTLHRISFSWVASLIVLAELCQYLAALLWWLKCVSCTIFFFSIWS